METNENAAICRWLTPTRAMPHPCWSVAKDRPWTCLRDGEPHPLDTAELEQCATCAGREARTFDDVRRDLVFEAWGVGGLPCRPSTFDEIRQDLIARAWGI